MKILLVICCVVSLAIGLAANQAGAEPQLVVDPTTSLHFAPCEDVQTMIIYNGGDGVLEWSTWVSEDYVTVVPPSGTNEPGWENRTTVSVYVDRTGLPYGRDLVNMYISGNFPRLLKFVDIFQNEGPHISVRPTIMYLSPDSDSDVLDINSLGSDPLEWSVSSDVPWLEISPVLEGVIPCPLDQELLVTLVPEHLPSTYDRHAGVLTVDSNGGVRTTEVEYLPPNANPGAFGVFMDSGGTDCNIIYQNAGLLPVYVVHVDFLGATAAQFAAPKPDCWTDATFLSDTDVFPIAIGNSQTGKAVGYGACMGPPMTVTTINYFVGGGVNPTCCRYLVVPDPSVPSGQIETVDCTNTIQYSWGLLAYINPDGTCFCGTVPVQETTWGRVKAMYGPDVIPDSR